MAQAPVIAENVRRTDALQGEFEKLQGRVLENANVVEELHADVRQVVQMLTPLKGLVDQFMPGPQPAEAGIPKHEIRNPTSGDPPPPVDNEGAGFDVPLGPDTVPADPSFNQSSPDNGQPSPAPATQGQGEGVAVMQNPATPPAPGGGDLMGWLQLFMKGVGMMEKEPAPQPNPAQPLAEAMGLMNTVFEVFTNAFTMTGNIRKSVLEEIQSISKVDKDVAKAALRAPEDEESNDEQR